MGSNPTLGAFLPAKFEHPCPDAAVHSTVSSDHKIRTKISLHTSSYRFSEKLGFSVAGWAIVLAGLRIA